MASKAASQNGPVLLSPCPSKAGYWCSRRERRPDVRLYRPGDQAGTMRSGSDLGCRPKRTNARGNPLTPKPSCEELEPPANPGRFNPSRRAETTPVVLRMARCCDVDAILLLLVLANSLTHFSPSKSCHRSTVRARPARIFSKSDARFAN